MTAVVSGLYYYKPFSGIPNCLLHSELNEVGMNSIPRWLQILLGEKFFTPCLVHDSAKKNERNVFCLDCCTIICLHCLHTHRAHRLLQIRRYVYNDVIRLGDAQKLMNCSFVQPYITNSAKVVFLHKRPITRPFKSSGNFCMKCDRNLQDSYIFCSISCKIHHLVTSKSGIYKHFNNSLVSLFDEARSLSFLELQETGQMTSDHSLHDSSVSVRTWSGSAKGARDASGDSAVSCRTIACSATIQSEKKKKRSVSSRQLQRCSTITRRKSVPHRAPLN